MMAAGETLLVIIASMGHYSESSPEALLHNATFTKLILGNRFIWTIADLSVMTRNYVLTNPRQCGKIFLPIVRGDEQMAKTSEELRELLIGVITEIQAGSGRSVPEIHGELCPIGDFEGFDSLNAVEVSCELSRRLDREIKPNLMVPAHPWKQLTINEIVGRLQQAVETQGGQLI
jgi:acyl carrier protein